MSKQVESKRSHLLADIRLSEVGPEDINYRKYCWALRGADKGPPKPICDVSWLEDYRNGLNAALVGLELESELELEKEDTLTSRLKHKLHNRVIQAILAALTVGGAGTGYVTLSGGQPSNLDVMEQQIIELQQLLHQHSMEMSVREERLRRIERRLDEMELGTGMWAR